MYKRSLNLSLKSVRKIFIRHRKQFIYPLTKVSVLGVPFDKGQKRKGVASGAKLLRDYNIIKKIQDIHDKMDVKDLGDFEYSIQQKIDKIPMNMVPENMRNYHHVISLSKQLSQRCEEIIKEDRQLLAIGGDHSLTIGTVHGHIKALQGKSEVGLLWVDAHADLNTNLTSESGNIHGMPMAILAEEFADFWPKLPGLESQEPILSVRNVAYIGLRSVDAFERLAIDKLGIPAFGIREVEKFGINTVMSMALQKIDPYSNRSLHVSFDIDALDKLEAPSTGTAVRGGLTLREGLHIMEKMYKTGRLAGVDLVEVNPDIGDEKDVRTTAEAAVLLILAAFGKKRKGLLPRVTSIEKYKVPPA